MKFAQKKPLKDQKKTLKFPKSAQSNKIQMLHKELTRLQNQFPTLDQLLN